MPLILLSPYRVLDNSIPIEFNPGSDPIFFGIRGVPTADYLFAQVSSDVNAVGVQSTSKGTFGQAAQDISVTGIQSEPQATFAQLNSNMDITGVKAR